MEDYHKEMEIIMIRDITYIVELKGRWRYNLKGREAHVRCLIWVFRHHEGQI
jgi:hypothetical protein